jgi:thymidylate synthase
MKIIEACGTNDLMKPVYQYLSSEGIPDHSRNGEVLRAPEPVALVHTNPIEHVNFCPIRNANPVFHLMEALAILAGHNDVAWLSQFNSKMVEYSDDGDTFNAFYGTRIKETWGDQLAGVISVLTDDPKSRQAVVNIWNPEDLTKDTLDKACNLSMVFSISPITGSLDMMVFNRSNDAIWGTVSGANEVQFPMIMLYVANALHAELGVYTHVTNNLHVYKGPQWDILRHEAKMTMEHWTPYPMVGYKLFDLNEKTTFDYELAQFINHTETLHSALSVTEFELPFFKHVAAPVFNAYRAHKLNSNPFTYVRPYGDNPWCIATRRWLDRLDVAKGKVVA